MGTRLCFFFHSENPLQTRADISSLFNFSLFFSSSSLMLSASVILFMRKCTHQKWLLTGNALQSPLRLWWSRSSVAELHSVSVESVRWRPRGRDGRPGIMQHVAGDFKKRRLWLISYSNAVEDLSIKSLYSCLIRDMWRCSVNRKHLLFSLTTAISPKGSLYSNTWSI